MRANNLQQSNESKFSGTRRQFMASAAGLVACTVATGCGADHPSANDRVPQTKAADEGSPRANAAIPQQKQTFESPPKGKIVWKTIASGPNGPGKRSRHEFTYDAKQRTLVLFGGIEWSSPSGKLFHDTWLFRDGEWLEAHCEVAPVARHRGAMVYDSVRGCSVLFGGQGQGSLRFRMLGDTWSFAGDQWRQIHFSTGSQPTPRCGHSLAFDENTGQTLLFGGITAEDRSLSDTWIFDGSTWTQLSVAGPTPRRYAAFAYDPALQGCVLQGGSLDDRGKKQYGETWLLRDNQWQYLGKSLDTVPCDDQALAWHGVAQRLVMCGGLTLPEAVLVCTADGWTKVEAESMPPRHQCAPMVWSPVHNGLVLHGGESRQGGKQFDATCLLEFVSEA